MSNLPELSPTQEDVTSLEKPFSEVDDVSSFCPKISTSFVLSMDNKGQSLGRPGGALGKHFAEVDRNFRYVAPNIDPGFSYFQVEALLDQAADLPERCLADRQLYDGYAVAAFSLGLELQEFCKLSELHDRETQAGYYSITYSMSYGEWQAQYTQASYILLDKDNNPYSHDHIKALQEAASAFEAAHVWLKIDPKFDLTKATYFFLDAINNTKTLETRDKPNDTEKLYPDAAARVAWFNYFLQGQAYEGQYLQAHEAIFDAALSKAVNNWSEASLNKRQYYDYVSAGFQYERTLISRWREGHKAQAATETGGVLNYTNKMDVVSARVSRDLADALARLSAASKGLGLLFGYDAAGLSQTLTDVLNGKDADGQRVIDEAVKWVRDAISFMVRFAHRDQGCVLPVTLKSVAKDWKGGLASGTWSFDLLADPRGVRPGLSLRWCQHSPS